MSTPWPLPIRLSEVDRGPVRLAPEADAATRALIAKAIGVDALDELEAKATLKPWLDGVELDGRVKAVVTQTCGISLEPFQTRIEAAFIVHALPPGSPNAPANEGPELVIDPEAEDPPDLLETEVIDVGAYLVEHLALEVDPFPRKPDAVFEPPSGGGVISPFAALEALKERKPPE